MKHSWINEYLMVKHGFAKDLRPERSRILSGKMFAAFLAALLLAVMLLPPGLPGGICCGRGQRQRKPV